MIFGSLLASTLSRWFPLPVTFLLISLVSFSGCALFSCTQPGTAPRARRRS